MFLSTEPVSFLILRVGRISTMSFRAHATWSVASSWALAYSASLWLNDDLYSAFCVLLYTQSALQSCGGGLSSTTTSVQHPLGWCDGCRRTTVPVRSPHTSYRWREERVIEPIKCMLSPHTSYRWRGERVIEPIKWMGIIRRLWLTRASGGNLARTPGLHPTLYEKCHGIFNDHRESGPQFNVSPERQCLLTV